MYFWLIAMLLAAAPAAADEKKKADDGNAASTPAVDKPAVPETVELLDGADSAEDALTAFVAASKAADDQAALLMVDPPIRKILIPEIAVERLAMDSVLTEYALFGENKNEIGGMLFFHAQRALINIQSVRIINTRIVDDDRVVFTVVSTSLGYDGEGTSSLVEEIMAIRRLGKWHVFKLFGVMTMMFLEGSLDEEDVGPLLREKQAPRELLPGLSADGEVEFVVPIELVHAEFVRSSESPETAAGQILANRLERLQNSINNRAKRGEYKTRGDLKTAFDQADSLTKEILTKHLEAIRHASKKLAKENLIKSENPANK